MIINTFFMPYDKDGKYYRKAVVPKKKGDSVDKIMKKANMQANILTTLVLAAIIGGCVAIFNSGNEPKRNKYYTPEIQDFDVCVKKQKAKGLSTDKCWDALPKE